jgi:tetratricopeptide (TPR) repeat protein
MLKKILFYLAFASILSSGFINYKVFRSLINQGLLIYEFNAYQLNLPLELVKSFNVDFPNISVTTLPLKTLKGRYFMRDLDTIMALKLYYQSLKDNPYIGISEFELSKYHFNKKNHDSAIYYSKIAFEALPRNRLLSRLHFEVLTKLKKDSLLDESFNKIKNYYILSQWRDYMFGKMQIGITPKEELAIILKEARNLFNDDNQFRSVENIIDIGYENLSDLGKMITEAETFFAKGQFIMAANVYETAAKINLSEYTHYENAALSYFKGNSFDDAERLFKDTMRKFNPKNGKVEFYYGLLLYQKDEKQEACKFWNISKDKGFAGSQRVIDTFCK